MTEFVLAAAGAAGMAGAAVALERARYWRIRYEGLRRAIDNRHPSIVGRFK
ncbi:hypothetical protein PBI_OKIROE_51 [Mycobacterium phage OkiRoe]|uniref:Uncharacterized protein n=2 Tax=Kratiovirus TaxID=2948788 RepID=A0A1C9EGV9_9CAUD|nr:hypothetical protein PBI_OKIROE_51 [Mycobacterium phage OkiRoe]YP_009282296.1 hypothetical protein SEA_GENGAR_51 [Mycobacterium phage Gengar]YP_009950763.1 hypothetical protein I5G73_gp48 [Mycobacterium phage Leston]AOQ28911.1 hypothetical protein SEA_WATERFOUL_52 [Mycobacterium phage Waterfoul]QXN73794.1 hypothetical protein SEA_SOSEPH_51 [Mycobacterium phage SoSeph]WNM65521.1 hypothetical protein SEA_HEFTYBOY_51 [Mycobacterium phage Heftyboy]AHZ95612.1 hypothetical protein PBI_OKIROE_51 